MRTPGRTDAGDGEPRGRLGRVVRKLSLRHKSPRERGIALVWLALTLLIMVAFAGFAVDLSNWYLRAERLQRAADAGAHAGVVFLPADLASATTRAKGEVRKNGYREGTAANTTVTVKQEANPNRLRVNVASDVPTYFLGLLGIDKIRMNRLAVAEYIAPVPMGSPENKVGNDPQNNYDSAQYWVNVAGPQSTKASGDRYQAKVCGTSVYNCTGTVNTGINNDDYAFDGYTYALKVTAKDGSNPLNIQAYDPAFVYVGDKCDSVTFPTTTELNNLKAWYGSDADQRYAGGLTKWCTGDQMINSKKDTQTSYIVRAPDNTPWSDTDNPVVCQTTFPAWDPSSGQNIYTRLFNERATVQDGKAPWNFSEVFRRNVTICSIPAANVVVGDYILQVRGNASSGNETTYNASNAQGGHNRLSIQVGFGSAVNNVDGSKVTINARGRFPIYANANSASTTFFLARVLPYDAGRTLRISLYDISDVGDSGTMQILPPSEYGSTFSGCSFSNDTNKSMTTSASTCTLTVPNGYYNERNVLVDVPIPTNYTCTTGSATGCWIKVRAAFNGAVQDTTTWSASILGNPVRLVE